MAALLEQPWDAPDPGVPETLAPQPRVAPKTLQRPRKPPMDPYFGLDPVRGGDADVERFVVFEAVDMHGRHAVVFRSHADRGVEEMLDRARTEVSGGSHCALVLLCDAWLQGS